ncbi:MAG: methyltransferase domain-containing protein [Planctomycetota bacterium]
MSPRVPLLVTIDVECDKDPAWRTRSPLSFRGVLEALPERLLPLFERLRIRATWMLSSEVLCNPDCMDLFRSLEGHELATHLHGEYVAPGLATLDFSTRSTSEMQWEYRTELEHAKLATLTQLFRQELGYAPLSFRAGRFGIGPGTGRILRELGYLVDSSVTPHVCWTSADGERRPDFTNAPELPWFVHEEGDLLTPGAGPLLQVPVTILRERGEARWFRPWYSDRDLLARIVESVVQAARHIPASIPLTMMFHNVELVPGASPYPQTDGEVARYLEDLEQTLTLALERGAEPMTLAELHEVLFAEQCMQDLPAEKPHADSPRNRGFRFPAERILEVLEREKAPAWFAYTVRERSERWDLTEPVAWLSERLPCDARILASGCGAGLNLLWLVEQGYAALHGFDVDPVVVRAGKALADEAGHDLRLWVDDGLDPRGIPQYGFHAVLALNWTHLAPEFSLPSFLERYARHLEDGGFLVLDVIDESFDSHPMHRWLSSDWTRPEAERRPSEYRHRYSAAEVARQAGRLGYRVEEVLARPQTIPRKVHVLKKLGFTARREPLASPSRRKGP